MLTETFEIKKTCFGGRMVYGLTLAIDFTADYRDTGIRIPVGCSGILKASFRGYPLEGKVITLPSGYKGIVVQESLKRQVEGVERNVHLTHTFKSLTFWNWDRTPSRNDAFIAAFDWIDLANALHSPCDTIVTRAVESELESLCALLLVRVVHICTSYSNELRMRKVEFKESVPTCVWKEIGKQFWKSTRQGFELRSPCHRQSSLHKNDALDHVTIEACERQCLNVFREGSPIKVFTTSSHTEPWPRNGPHPLEGINSAMEYATGTIATTNDKRRTNIKSEFDRDTRPTVLKVVGETDSKTDRVCALVSISFSLSSKHARAFFLSSMLLPIARCTQAGAETDKNNDASKN
uniref:Uncharacterized protein n=1 Tax=Timema tahoe TaxID=61484 RepID=A0A7R9IFM9_9NEOP|nr:unnamed protein product [Timema tahoe]